MACGDETADVLPLAAHSGVKPVPFLVADLVAISRLCHLRWIGAHVSTEVGTPGEHIHRRLLELVDDLAELFRGQHGRELRKGETGPVTVDDDTRRRLGGIWCLGATCGKQKEG